MHTTSSILIDAPREEVFAALSDLALWPQLMPQFREIEFLGQQNERRLVRVRCQRGGLPISCVASYQADARALELRFLHLRSWTRGMEVIWRLNSTRDGCRVEITHDWRAALPGLAWLMELIAASLFVRPIAEGSLAALKLALETPASARVRSWELDDEEEDV